MGKKTKHRPIRRMLRFVFRLAIVGPLKLIGLAVRWAWLPALLFAAILAHSALAQCSGGMCRGGGCSSGSCGMGGGCGGGSYSMGGCSSGSCGMGFGGCSGGSCGMSSGMFDSSMAFVQQPRIPRQYAPASDTKAIIAAGREAGIRSLGGDREPKLLRAALDHSHAMADAQNASHVGWQSRSRKFGEDYQCREVVAEGRSAEEVWQAWLDCPENAAIVDSDADVHGFAMSRGTNGVWYGCGIVGNHRPQVSVLKNPGRLLDEPRDHLVDTNKKAGRSIRVVCPECGKSFVQPINIVLSPPTDTHWVAQGYGGK